jgi:hypothetical protein
VIPFIFDAVIWTGWILFAGFIAVAVGTMLRNPRLLDGRTLQSVLDDKDRRHAVAVHTARDQPLALFAAELDEILALPTREPRA